MTDEVPEDRLAGRAAFMRLDAAARSRLREAWAIVEPGLDTILDRFYAHLAAEPGMAALLARHATQGVEGLKRAQREHWRRLFSGRFDAEYEAGVRRVGRAHARIGLDPRWYLGGYALALGEIGRTVAARMRWNAPRAAALMDAVTAAVLLDMDLAIEVYFEEGPAVQARRRELAAVATRLEGAVGGVAQAVVATAGELRAGTETLALLARRSAERAGAVAAASSQTSANVATVAAAAEELSASVAEITRQVADSARIARSAVARAAETDATVQGLAEGARKIGEVVRLINDIAAQTNLLALNATIEAARAGEAGKGFAVVASEVKTLASQTAKATEEIGNQIAAIQGETDRAVGAIRSIGAVIEEIDRIAAAIAAAVEQQGTATAEIARNVQQAAAGTGEVDAAIAEVNAATAETADAVAALGASAAGLADNGETLRREVETFLAALRAA